MRFVVLVVALCLAALMCVGCAKDAEPAPPVAVTIPKVQAKPPVPAECDPSGRAAFPKVQKQTGDKTPTEAVEDAYNKAKAADATNEQREITCWRGVNAMSS